MSWTFLKTFLAHPFSLGSVVPSSPALAAQMASACFNSSAGHEVPKLLVEIGPGTGALTEGLLDVLPPGWSYVGIELHEEFVISLRKKFPAARFIVGSAEGLHALLEKAGVAQAGAVVASVPWSLFPAKKRARIFGEIRACLAPQGRFVTFLYVHAGLMPSGFRFLEELRNCFGGVRKLPVTWLNFPPAIVLACTRIERVSSASDRQDPAPH